MAPESSNKTRRGANGAPSSYAAEIKETMRQIGSLMQEAATEVGRAEELRQLIGAALVDIEEQARQREELLRQRLAAAEESETKMAARIRELEAELAAQKEMAEKDQLKLRPSGGQGADTRTAVLEAQLKEELGKLREKEAALKALQDSTAAQIRELETQLGKGAEMLRAREAEIEDLRARLDGLQRSRERGVVVAEENIVLLEEVAQGEESESVSAEAARQRTVEAGPARREIAPRPGARAERAGAPDQKKSRWASLLAPVRKGK